MLRLWDYVDDGKYNGKKVKKTAKFALEKRKLAVITIKREDGEKRRKQDYYECRQIKLKIFQIILQKWSSVAPGCEHEFLSF